MYGRREYANARVDRLTAAWNPGNSSADSELVSGLTRMRARSRALVRDSSYAKRARVLVVNNIIGTGIGMQAQVYGTRGELAKRVNADIEAAWGEWCSADSCHTGGRLHFAAFERAAMGQVFEAGEVFIRKHYSAFGDSRVPLALELIEAERIADEYSYPMGVMAPGAHIRMGVEVDQFFRPVAYWIKKRHPSEHRFNTHIDGIERVPADQIFHLAVIDRWPQTRGEPWMHTALRRLNDMDGYSEAEIVRARGQAVRMGIIETPENALSFGEEQPDGSIEMEMEPGYVGRLNPGEKWHDSSPTAPNPQLDPFMRYMLREFSAGTGPSYASVSRDYSQSTYSSERVARLDDVDLWRVYQSWFIADFRMLLHREWLRMAVLAGAVRSISVAEYASNAEKFEAVRFRPRGWSWVDPTKEVEAYRTAVRSGFMTLQDVVSASGADFEELIDQRKKEIEMTAQAGLVFDTDPDQVSDSGAVQAPEKPAETPPQTGGEVKDDESPPPRRVFSIQR